jgi:hypothetical protein
VIFAKLAKICLRKINEKRKCQLLPAKEYTKMEKIKKTNIKFRLYI